MTFLLNGVYINDFRRYIADISFYGVIRRWQNKAVRDCDALASCLLNPRLLVESVERKKIDKKGNEKRKVNPQRDSNPRGESQDCFYILIQLCGMLPFTISFRIFDRLFYIIVIHFQISHCL